MTWDAAQKASQAAYSGVARSAGKYRIFKIVQDAINCAVGGLQTLDKMFPVLNFQILTDSEQYSYLRVAIKDVSVSKHLIC